MPGRWGIGEKNFILTAERRRLGLSTATVDFVIAGAAKSGTTGLGNHLRACAQHVCLTPTEDHRIDFVESYFTEDHIFRPLSLDNEESCNKENPPVMLGMQNPAYMYLVDDETARYIKSW